MTRRVCSVQSLLFLFFLYPPWEGSECTNLERAGTDFSENFAVGVSVRHNGCRTASYCAYSMPSGERQMRGTRLPKAVNLRNSGGMCQSR
jgi:hypothetical protein